MEIDLSSEELSQLIESLRSRSLRDLAEALPPLRRQVLLDAIAALIQPRWPEANLAAVEFIRRP